MTVDLWGFDGKVSFGLPLRPLGHALLLLYALVLLVLCLNDLKKRKREGRRGLNQTEAAWLGMLIVAGVIASGVFLFYLPGAGLPVAPGVPRQASAPYFAAFAALPWMLAAGTLGLWPAVVVAVASGLSAAAVETASLMTPLIFGMVAGLCSLCLRNPYAEWPGRLLRHPAVAGVVGGLALGFLSGVEVLVFAGGSLLDGLGFMAAQLNGLLIAGLLQVLIAGVIAEAFRLTIPELWYRPRALQAGPYSRSLAAKTVSVFGVAGLVFAATMLYGDWLLARSAARQLIGARLSQTAELAAESIPYAVQAGRSYAAQIGGEISDNVLNGDLNADELERWLTLLPYFNSLVVLDSQGQVLVHTPGVKPDAALLTAIQPALRLSRLGVSEEVVVRPGQGSRGARLAFVSPIESPDLEAPVGSLVAWTDLSRNPLLLPVLGRLADVEPGEAYVTDESGTIILHPTPARVMDSVPVDPDSAGEVHTQTASDGTRQLSYISAVGGYPWWVVVTSPQGAVDLLAARIAGQLTAVIAAVGSLALLVVYLISRRITRPLREMAGAADTIASGDLSQPVTVSGQDETGRLGASFERMRRGLESRMGEMDGLLRISQQLATTFDLSVALPRVLAATREMTQAELVRLVLLGESEARPGVPAEAYTAGSDPGGWASLDPPILDLARQRGAFVLDNPARARGLLNLQALRVPILALAGAPIRNEGRFIGVLWLGYLDPHVFTQEEAGLLSIIASQLAVSVANARLFQQAEQERLRMGAVLEATPDAVLVTDRAGRILLANPAAEIVLRGPADACIGLPASDWVDSPELLALLLDDAPEDRTLELKVEGGKVLFGTAMTVEDPSDARFYGRVCVLWDVSQFKKLDMLKSEFVATVSHDLRSPLTLMSGYTTMLPMVGALNDQQKEFIRKISDSVEQMTQLVDNLLDLGRIEAGIGLSLESVAPESMVAEVVQAYQAQAATKRISLSQEVAAHQRPIQADRTLLRQALANLVDNAVKYTQAGGRVVVRARQVGSRQLFTVEDTGVGIAPTDQARLFEKFYRARRKENLRERGSGLGLAIVKSIAEQHGGRVSVESQLGAGSVFIIDVPTSLTAEQARP
ncbi:MAG: ATP-binding protein [Anaerolineales bacterium]|nr:ATP-binding protein [Anaerolineales bacterium]